MSRRDSFNPVAQEIPFDNTGTDFESDNVQEALTEIGASASPGFSWGRGGNSSTGTWLNNEGVSSNRSGRIVFINNPELFAIFVNSRTLSTYTIGVYEHEGNEINLTLLDTLSITSARGGSKLTSVNITAGRQLAIRIESGSAQDIVAGVVLRGST